MVDISYTYTKLRRDFGRQPMFCEMGPLLCDSITENLAERRAYILRNPVHTPTQHGPVFSKHSVNTIRAVYTTTGANHAEGGWPKDVNILDPEMTQRYRRKVEKDDGYIHCIQAVSPMMDYYILQNNAIEMYHTYYVELPGVSPPERISCRTVNVYRDPKPTGAGSAGASGRPISSIGFQPDGGRRFAIVYLDVDFGRSPRARASTECFLWDVENANDPTTLIKPPCGMLDLQFNPRDINMLAGGLINGQVGIWDARVGGAMLNACAAHAAHRDLVRRVIFINSKSGLEFFSTGPDGAVKWWDVRALEEPTEVMLMDLVTHSLATQSMATANGVSALEFEPTIPSRFMVGTENGLVICGNRKGKTPMEKLPVKFSAHLGPVWSLERNPGFLKNFLSVGDWTARVWNEDCHESAVIWSPPQRYKINAGIWSPTRLSLMSLAQQDGVLALWDLMRRQHEPVLTVQLCQEPLLRLCAHDQGSLIACGSRNGNIYMTELSQSLAQSDKNDKVLMTLMFERESKRERILESRMREIRLKQRQAEEGGGAAAGAEGGEEDPTIEAMIGDRDLAEATANFMSQVKKDLASM